MVLTGADWGHRREVTAWVVSELVSVHVSGGARAYGQAGSGSPMRVPPGVEADPLDDATLVARSRDGDMRSYEVLVRRYQGPIYRLALRMLGSAGDAEDAVQEVFLTVWRRLSQLQDDVAFVGWLYRTATNRCLNVIRARRPQADVELDEHESVSPRSRPDHVAEVSEQMSALGQALTSLTPEQRACWLLREVHGRSYDEIAHAIGTTSQAVRGRIARARAQLAEVMAPWR